MVGTSGRGKFMVWRDLTAEVLQLIRHPHPAKGLSGRDHIALAVGISPKQQGEPKNAIDLDLYVQTLQYAEEHGFADNKASGLFSIVREVHRRAAGERLTLEVSFAHFKHLLLIHSVHRPPQSIALFTYAEMRGILAWMVDTYYRHYKLYQYTFTNRCTMSVASRHPLDIIELPPVLPPLMEALTEAQHQAQVAAQEAEEASARKVAEQQAAEEAEQERLRLLRDAYIAATGDEIRDRINSVLQKEVGLLRQALNQEFNLSLPPVDGGKGHFPAIKSKNDGPRLAKVDAAAATPSLGDPAALEPGLHVKLVSATGLKSMDFYGKMDPYARLVLGGQKHTSLVADDSGTEPVWNQAFLFKQYEQEKILQVTLVDDDAGPIDETIGTVAVSLAGAKAQSGELQLLELPVMLPSGKPMGKLTLELCAVVAK